MSSERAVGAIGGKTIPNEDIAVEGSQDLQSLFSRHSAHGVPLANDTSFGVGHALSLS